MEELKQETKSDIQELFEEIFVKDLRQNITNISIETEGREKEIKEFTNYFKKQVSQFLDETESIKELMAEGDEQLKGVIDNLNVVLRVLNEKINGYRELLEENGAEIAKIASYLEENANVNKRVQCILAEQNEAISALSALISSNMTVYEKGFNSLNNEIKLNNEIIIEKCENFWLQSKKRIIYWACGLGLITVLNISILIVQLIK